MDFELPSDDDPRRLEVRAWLAEHPKPTGRQLAEAGYVAPHWPKPYGLDADPIQQIIVDDELKKARVSRPTNIIGIGWAGPTILHAGSEEQKDRYLLPLLAGEETWCQLFSEPEAGSDLAGLRTRAVRDGDEYVVNGQKIWTSGAHQSKFGILIARTNPDAPKHKGISYFICPMDAPGIEIRPIVEMTGIHLFNEVFFTDVRIPAANLVGNENEGWTLAKVTLGNERVSLSSGGALWGWDRPPTTCSTSCGPTGASAIPCCASGSPSSTSKRRSSTSSACERSPPASVAISPGPRRRSARCSPTSTVSASWDSPATCAAPGAMVASAGPLGTPAEPWYHGYLFSPALTIGGGTGEVQRNIVAERVLGLPADPVA